MTGTRCMALKEPSTALLSIREATWEKLLTTTCAISAECVEYASIDGIDRYDPKIDPSLSDASIVAHLLEGLI